MEPLKKYKGVRIHISTNDAGISAGWVDNPTELLRLLDKIVAEGANVIDLWKKDAIMLEEHLSSSPPIETTLPLRNNLQVKELGDLA